jgi:hypothetical protein
LKEYAADLIIAFDMVDAVLEKPGSRFTHPMFCCRRFSASGEVWASNTKQ